MREKIINKRNIVILVIVLAAALIGSAIYASTNTKTTKSIKTPMTKEISSKKQEKKAGKKVESEKKEEQKDKEVKEEKKVADNKEVTSNKASNKTTPAATKTPATTSNTPKAPAQPQKKLITKIIHHHELGHTEDRLFAADGTDITDWTNEQTTAYMKKIKSARAYNKGVYVIDRPAYDERIQVWADISSPDVVEEWTDN